MDREECIVTINSVLRIVNFPEIVELLKHLCELRSIMYEGYAEGLTTSLVVLASIYPNIIDALIEEHQISSITKNGKLISVY